jgi:sulfoxide reductase heme-binding subunit YedZ
MEFSNVIGSWFSVWDTTRALGLTAYLLLFVSVVVGLLQSLKAMPPRALIHASVLHSFTGWLGLLFSITHGLVLIYDTYVGYSFLEILVPFTAKKDSFEIALGIISFYIIFALVLSSDLLGRIGIKSWRVMHFLSFPAFLFALYHGVAIGTDTAIPEIKLFYALTGSIVAFLIVIRILKRADTKAESNS